MIALHKNGLDVFSVPCYFFEIILPALQGSAAVSAVRCSMERMIPSSVLLLSRSSNFFTAELLVPLKQMMHPRQIRLVRILFKFLGGILVRTRCGSKAPAMGPAKRSFRLNCIFSLGIFDNLTKPFLNVGHKKFLSYTLFLKLFPNLLFALCRNRYVSYIPRIAVTSSKLFA